MKEGDIIKIPGFTVKVKKAIPLDKDALNIFCSFGISDFDGKIFTDEWVSVSKEKICKYVPAKSDVCMSCRGFKDMWTCYDCVCYSRYSPSAQLKQVMLLNGWELTRKEPTRIVLGFPGVGKSYTKKALSGKYKILDLDSSEFKGDNNFPRNYIDLVEMYVMKKEYDLILISAEESVCNCIKNRPCITDCSAISICYPAIWLRDDWLDMLLRNDNYDVESYGFIRDNFEKWVNTIESYEWCHKIKICHIDDTLLNRLAELRIYHVGDSGPHPL